MSVLEKSSRKGSPRRPKIEASAILEALYSLALERRVRTHPATIREIAERAECSRNAARDRLFELSASAFLVKESLRPYRLQAGRNGGRRPKVYAITEDGINAVAKIQAKRELLATEVDLETQGERFDRAADFLECEAAAVDARLADAPGVDPRQITLGDWVAQKSTPGFNDRGAA